jgi:hypothetical protein
MPSDNKSGMLSNLLTKLIDYTYQDLKDKDIMIHWAKLHSYAEVRWDEENLSIEISCDESVKGWHEAAVIGLLAHELSHPARRGISESQTDFDVINRGLGVYLAFERVISGRYNDTIINRGKDRYLGYVTIRKEMEDFQMKQLDKLMEWRRIKPVEQKLVHDSIIINRADRLVLSVGEDIFKDVDISPNADIKLIIRDSKTYIYADDVLISQLDVEL